VGYIAGGFALFGLSEERAIQQLALAASIFYMIHHILVKSALFFSGSWNQSVFGSTQLASHGGLRSLQITLSLLFVIPAMSLAGLPPFSGFWAKLGVLQVSLEVSEFWYFFAAILAGLFTFFSMLKIWMQSYLGTAPSTPRAISQKWIYILGIAFLVVPSLWISLLPATLFEWSEQAAQSLLQSMISGGRP
jgi:multicomponent Na+:H+ antiporter subunit D